MSYRLVFVPTGDKQSHVITCDDYKIFKYYVQYEKEGILHMIPFNNLYEMEVHEIAEE